MLSLFSMKYITKNQVILLFHYGFSVYLHHEFLDAFHVRFVRQYGVHRSVLEVLLPFADQIKELRFESMVTVLELPVADIHQQGMLHIPVSMHLPGLQEFRPGAEQPDKMHSMLVQVPVVLFPVPVVQLLILPDDF